MSDWDRIFDDLEREEEGRQVDRRGFVRRVAAAFVLLCIVLAVCVAAFARQAAAAEAERFSIPYFQAMKEDAFAQTIVLCRSNTRHAETHTCRNAELAYERRYAEVLRRNHKAMMDSPLFWAANPFNAYNVQRACGAGERWALKWCGVVASVYGRNA